MTSLTQAQRIALDALPKDGGLILVTDTAVMYRSLPRDLVYVETVRVETVRVPGNPYSLGADPRGVRPTENTYACITAEGLAALSATPPVSGDEETMRLLRAQIGEMTRALLRCHEQFTHYATQHEAKTGSPDAAGKARVNRDMAAMCSAALRAKGDLL